MEMTIPEPKKGTRGKRELSVQQPAVQTKIRVIIKVFSYLAKDPETVCCDSPPITVLVMEATSRHQSVMIL